MDKEINFVLHEHSLQQALLSQIISQRQPLLILGRIECLHETE